MRSNLKILLREKNNSGRRSANGASKNIRRESLGTSGRAVPQATAAILRHSPQVGHPGSKGSKGMKVQVSGHCESVKVQQSAHSPEPPESHHRQGFAEHSEFWVQGGEEQAQAVDPRDSTQRSAKQNTLPLLILLRALRNSFIIYSSIWMPRNSLRKARIGHFLGQSADTTESKGACQVYKATRQDGDEQRIEAGAGRPSVLGLFGPMLRY